MSRKYYPNEDKIISCDSPEICYFLGFMWADGWVEKSTTSVKLSIHENDMLDLETLILENVGAVKITYTQNKNYDSSSGNMYFGSKRVSNWMKDMDFSKKSLVSPVKLLDNIDTELHSYFWRGFFDGDGGLYVKGRKLTFHGSIDQDWSSLKNLLESLNVNYSYNKTVRNKCKSSFIQIRQSNSILNLINYLYKGKQFGLSRKLKTIHQFKSEFHTIKLKSPDIPKGISYCPSQNKPWKATIYANEKNKLMKDIFVGWFATQKDAELALCKNTLG
jgi:hypothetical protein